MAADGVARTMQPWHRVRAASTRARLRVRYKPLRPCERQREAGDDDPHATGRVTPTAHTPRPDVLNGVAPPDDAERARAVRPEPTEHEPTKSGHDAAAHDVGV